jgi:hypothetical protein
MFDESTPHEAPCWLALLAGSLALMTAHAAPPPGAPASTPCSRALIVRKIISNLARLRGHPHAPPGLRQVAANMHGLWLPLALDAHGAPGRVAETPAWLQ